MYFLSAVKEVQGIFFLDFLGMQKWCVVVYSGTVLKKISLKSHTR